MPPDIRSRPWLPEGDEVSSVSRMTVPLCGSTSVYLKAYTAVLEALRELDDYFLFYNWVRPHQALGHPRP